MCSLEDLMNENLLCSPMTQTLDVDLVCAVLLLCPCPCCSCASPMPSQLAAAVAKRIPDLAPSLSVLASALPHTLLPLYAPFFAITLPTCHLAVLLLVF